ncbi:hypothetical protein NOF04DRAFT_9051 [Fusarium oxysporum II5]|uniref:Uncharacterized protein n=2 Tax=Fusarium oxysporum species complex TaxID=171631 RepID=X0KLB1_FUSO5|nr:uncharacterized protein FOIG_02325 [Fusarium odoratissimum NRRL 54006]EXM09547.1 hypothetical protein FOIG_02325 [Fusarium odoratissimum NRRL 54006]KAK2128370.1 hypothetical protein NOF04DRAFT_9051 [Fusarium oxysporum II5]TXC06321.1 hypothetical protein FocTR4_00010205 [Fusarium oxysporum f. sp. cubense]
MGLNGTSKLAMILSSCSTDFGVEVFLVCVQFRSFSSNVRAMGPLLWTYRNVSADPPHEPPPEGLSRKAMSGFLSLAIEIVCILIWPRDWLSSDIASRLKLWGL